MQTRKTREAKSNENRMEKRGEERGREKCFNFSDVGAHFLTTRLTRNYPKVACKSAKPSTSRARASMKYLSL